MSENLYASNKKTLNSANYDLFIDVDEIPANIDFTDLADLKKQLQRHISIAKNINIDLSNAVISKQNNLLLHSNASMRLGTLDDFIPIPKSRDSKEHKPVLDFNVYYVSISGDDSDDGLTRETAFKTLNRAVSLLNDNDVVILLNGVHSISESIEFVKSCSIQGENVNSTIIELGEDVELTIPPNWDEETLTDVSLFNLQLKADKTYNYSKVHHYVNQGDTMIKIGKEVIL